MSCQPTLDTGRSKPLLSKPLRIWNLSAVRFESVILANALAEPESEIISGSSYCEFKIFTHKNKRSDSNQEKFPFEFRSPSLNASKLFILVYYCGRVL